VSDPTSGLVRSFAVGGDPIDGRVVGPGPVAEADGVLVRVRSAARATDGSLTVVLATDNQSPMDVEWFGFAATYAVPDGDVVEASGAWGPATVAAGTSGELLVGFPSGDLGGVVRVTGLRDDGIDLSVEATVPSPS
jgi:hypothetical protein